MNIITKFLNWLGVHDEHRVTSSYLVGELARLTRVINEKNIATQNYTTMWAQRVEQLEAAIKRMDNETAPGGSRFVRSQLPPPIPRSDFVDAFAYGVAGNPGSPMRQEPTMAKRVDDLAQRTARLEAKLDGQSNWKMVQQLDQRVVAIETNWKPGDFGGQIVNLTRAVSELGKLFEEEKAFTRRLAQRLLFLERRESKRETAVRQLWESVNGDASDHSQGSSPHGDAGDGQALGGHAYAAAVAQAARPPFRSNGGVDFGGVSQTISERGPRSPNPYVDGVGSPPFGLSRP